MSHSKPLKRAIFLTLENTPNVPKYLNALQSSVAELAYETTVFEKERPVDALRVFCQEVLESRNTVPFLIYIRCQDDFVDRLNAILSNRTTVHYHQHLLVFIDIISNCESPGTLELPPDTLVFLSSTSGDSPNLNLFQQKVASCFVLASDEDILETCSKVHSMCADIHGWQGKVFSTLRSKVILKSGLPHQPSDSVSAPGFVRTLSLILFGIISSDRHSAYDFFLVLRQRIGDADISILRNGDSLNLLQATIEKVRLPYLRVFFLLGLWPRLYGDRVPEESRSSAAGLTTEQWMTQSVKSRKFILKARELTKWEKTLNPLHVACREGVLYKVNDLLQLHLTKINATDGKGYNCLHWACVSGNIDIVKVLLEKKMGDKATKNGETAMHIAASMGHSPLVALLASKGFEASKKDASHMTPMDQTAVNGDLVCLRTLMACRVPLEPTLLTHAAANGHLKYVQALLKEHGASPNAEDWKGRTALMLAASNDHLDIAKELIQAGVNWQITDDFHRNVLHHATDAGSSDMVQMLISEAGDQLPNLINEHDFYAAADQCFLIRGRDRGKKAWHYVESRRYLVHAFLKSANEGTVDVSKFGRPVKSGWGSDPEEEEMNRIKENFKEKYTKSSNGQTLVPNDMTPLLLACFREKSTIVEVLLKEGADPNAVDASANTSLHLAAMRGHIQISGLLLAHNARADLRNAEGKTPKDVAQLNGQTEIYNFFINQPCNEKLEDFVQSLLTISNQFKLTSLNSIREGGTDIRQFLIETLRDCNIEINQFVATLDEVDE